MKHLLQDKFVVKRLSALTAGGLVPFAYAPFDLFFLVVISLSILFYLWSTTDSARESFILGYLFGFSMFGIGVNWLHISINLFGGVNIVGALTFTYIFIAYLSLYPALCGYLATRFSKRFYIIVLPSLWLITEWCRGWFLTGFPWLNIGASQTDSILASFAPVFGVYGVSFFVCLLAITLTLLITEFRKYKIISFVLLLLTTLALVALNNTNWTAKLNKEIDVVLVQGAITQEQKWLPEKRQQTYTIYSKLSKPYWSSDLIVWPETAIPSLYHFADDFINGISEQKQNKNALFMSGLAYQDPATKKYYNSVLLIDDKHHFYHKHHLVPFGEYLPLKSILGEVLQFLKIPMSDFSSGDLDQKLFITDKGVFGMSICYEDAYGSEIRNALPDANILINVSNDAWFGNSFAPHQHLQMARMRAIENGRYLLRSTNTGISAIIDNKGNIVSKSPQFEPHTLAATVKLFKGETFYSRFGNSPIIIICCFILLLCFVLNPKVTRVKPQHPV
jgi:apolipoprotein N-acyltransferase